MEYSTKGLTDMNHDNAYRSFFWKWLFIVFPPIFLIGILSDSNIWRNQFRELEDYGSFIFFLSYYFIAIFGITAFFISFAWRVKQSKK